MKFYQGLISSLPENGIFVFGSNTQGRHGKGAALVAKEKFGAIYGQASGLQGKSYAIITKDLNSEIQPSRTPEQIKEQIRKLYEFAQSNLNLNFYIAYTTMNGDNNLNCYSNKDLAKIFASFEIIPKNIYFEKGFYELVNLFRKKEKIVIIAGGRNFNNYLFLEEKCYQILSPFLEKGYKITIREGEAKGADTLGVKFALDNNFDLQRYFAKWDLNGKRAGYIRNKEMALGKNGDKPADILIAFWDGLSKGTQHMIKIMQEETVFTSIHICRYDKI